MFDLDRFIEDCLSLSRGEHAPKRVLERMREAVADPDAIKRAVAPLDAKVGVLDAPLYRSPELTVLNVTLRPGVLSIPHDHRMWAVIGIYGGEDRHLRLGLRAGRGQDRRGRVHHLAVSQGRNLSVAAESRGAPQDQRDGWRRDRGRDGGPAPQIAATTQERRSRA